MPLEIARIKGIANLAKQFKTIFRLFLSAIHMSVTG